MNQQRQNKFWLIILYYGRFREIFFKPIFLLVKNKRKCFSSIISFVFEIKVVFLQKLFVLNKIDAVIYALAALFMGIFLYLYFEYYIYIVGIFFSFLFLNVLLFRMYKGLKKMPMAVMAFMALNFGKDILWVFIWMFVIKKNEVLVMFLALVFLLLSIPLYHSVLREIKNNQKSDKNQL